MKGNWIRYFFSLGVIIGIYAAIKLRIFGLLFRRADLRTRNEWGQISDTPDADKNYPPQGMTIVDDDVLMTNHWKGKKSGLYRLNPETGVIKDSAVMPCEAKHTSGLSWDGDYLWAVDHKCNVLYKLDLERTFAEGDAVVRKRTDTGLHACSGLTLLEADGRKYVAISDFLWTIETTPSLPIGSARTFIIPRNKIWNESPVPDLAEVSYSNGGYSQGLTWDGTYLYESLNNIGTNRIEVIDISRAIGDDGHGDIKRIGSLETPGYFVEDLGTDGNVLWTSDERQYELYKLNGLDEIKQRLR